jgi:Protein of unknown function (DUF1670)
MMNRTSPPPSPTYAANGRKTFHSTLCHLLRKMFPGQFGSDVTRLFADKVEALYERCHPPLSRVKVGQVLWLAVAADDLPSRHKRIEDTNLVPVLLDLVTPQDITDTAATGKRLDIRRAKIVRLFRQAHAQGGILSEADVALLLHVADSRVSEAVVAHERASGETVPRRGTIHDMGRSVTHKGIICYKRLVEKKPTSQVAEETFHTADAVEYYVQCLRRIQLCYDNGMSLEEIALATGHSLSLVREHLDLICELDLPPYPNPDRKEDGAPAQPTA